MKLRLVGAQFSHADGRMDMTKLIDTFCNFANAPKNVQSLSSTESGLLGCAQSSQVPIMTTQFRPHNS
jgi:hypothetical protein